MTKKFMTVGIVLLFIGTCIIPGIAQKIEKAYEQSSESNWLYVGGTGPGNYSTIQAAIYASKDGDTIFVFDDKSPYVESIVIDKSIQLLGENKKTTVINGNSASIIVQILNCSDVTIQGFTIRNAHKTLILLDSCIDCLITDNILRGSGQCGFSVTYGGNNTIANNTIICVSLNTIWRSQGNIVIGNSISFVFQGLCACSGTKIYSNKIRFIGLNGLEPSGFCDIRGNTIAFCRLHGIEIGGGTNITLQFNTFIGNTNAILLFGDQVNVTSNNFILNIHNVLIASVGQYYFDGNFWNRPMSHPKVIIDLKKVVIREPGTNGIWDPGLTILFPKLLFDLHPAQAPYDIPGMTLENIWN